ncbi:cobalamin-independent methionine synthase II family protein, partial [Psychrobacter sp. 1Y1]
PRVDEIVSLMEKAASKVAVEQLWINPDCGLKTRTWDEVEPALVNLVEATKILRRKLG